MDRHPIFLSLVIVTRNQSECIAKILSEAAHCLKQHVSDYELIYIDNASDDQTAQVITQLSGANGLANIQAYFLTKEVNLDMASWVGIENALGDFVAVLDPLTDDVCILPQILEASMKGADIVLAHNEQKPLQSILYRCAQYVFDKICLWIDGLSPSKDLSHYQMLSRRVINFILQHPHPALTYCHLPSLSGFRRVRVNYTAPVHSQRPKSLWEAVDKGIRLLVSTTRGPMRVVTLLSLFGALSNVLYSLYVVTIYIVKSNVAPGWVSLSLQQSGMFFLLSLVMLVLGEYIIAMVKNANEGPPYCIASEVTSVHMTQRDKLNVESVSIQMPKKQG